MGKYIIMDDRHYMGAEDFFQYVHWKVKELQALSFSYESIISFYDNSEWEKQVRKIRSNETNLQNG